jgi:Xanthomonas XOO_2897-like deaminase
MRAALTVVRLNGREDAMANVKFAVDKDNAPEPDRRPVAPKGPGSARSGQHFASYAAARHSAGGVVCRRTVRRVAATIWVVLALLIGLAAPVGAVPPTFIKIPWGSGIGEGAVWYRDQFPNVSPGRDVVVFEYTYPNGERGSMALESASYGTQGLSENAVVGHAERRLGTLLQQHDIDPDDVDAIYSELAPCDYQSCDTWIAKMFPNAKVYYSFDYGGSKATNTAGVKALKTAVKEHNTEKEEAEDVMEPPGDEPEAGALAETLSDPMEVDPGGIDFSSLELRYVAISGPQGGDVHYAMDGSRSFTETATSTGVQTAREDSAAFFTWLVLPPNTFWVNLTPNVPPRIIDPQLAQTEAGRVLLQSDFLLKRATVPALNPDVQNALQFWRQVYRLPQPPVSHCLAYRLWIVPGVATVHATSTQLYILNAPLNVDMAPVTHLPGKVIGNICPQTPWLVGYEALYRKLIVPELERVVNSAPQFAPLRRVYMSRVAAQWVRQDVARNTVLGRLVNSGNTEHWRAQPPWLPLTIWKKYLKIFDTPQAHYKVPVQKGSVTEQTTVTVNGGVDFSHVTEVNTPDREFKDRYPGLAAAAKVSNSLPSAGDGTVWLGAGTSASSNMLPRPLIVPSTVGAL